MAIVFPEDSIETPIDKTAYLSYFGAILSVPIGVVLVMMAWLS